MGSSKSAQALITQFNYEELGMRVWLIKPSIDDRDGASIVKSRVGLFREADVIFPEDNLYDRYQAGEHYDVIIADEAQFFTPEQIDQLRQIVDEADRSALQTVFSWRTIIGTVFSRVSTSMAFCSIRFNIVKVAL